MTPRSTLRWTSVTMAAAVAVTMIAHAQSSPRDLFERGRLLEENVATLEQAVKAYEQVVALAKSDRALTAEALLRVALIRERQGRPEARALFARVAERYPEQTATAAAARAKVNPSPSEMVARRIWAGAGANADGRPSLDGRFLTFVEWTSSTGNVGIRDLMTDENRLLTHATGNDGGHADDPVLSPDNGEVAYVWNDTEIRLVRVDGSRDRLLLKPDGDPVNLAWAPDGRQLAAVINRSGHTYQIVTISIGNHSTTALKATGWNFPVLGGFSPDGKYLVYSLAHTSPATDGGIFAIAVDGSRDTLLVQSPNEDHAPVWTPDGRGIVFLSDRSGARALWHVRVRDGVARGEPELLRTAIGDLNMGFTRDGSYFYGARNIQRDAYLVEIDPDTLATTGTPARLSERFIGANAGPVWSPDGKFIAFVRGTETTSLVIRSVADGVERTLPTLLPRRASFGPEWFPDGRTLLIGETDYPNRRAIFRRVDVETGSDSPLFSTLYAGIYGRVRVSNDGRSLFYSFRTDGDVVHLMRRDLASGNETDLYRTGSDGVGVFGLSLSIDGERLAFNLNVPQSEQSRGEGPRALRTISINGGAPRELMRGGYSCPAPTSASWTRNARYVVAICDDGQRRRLWAIPTDGGEPRKLDIVMDQIGTVEVSPDGRRIALTGSTRQPEVWVVRNLLANVR